MYPSLQIGNTAELVIEVDDTMCPAFDGVIVHRVYSTWSLAHHMEIAARKVLIDHLEPHEEGIGSHLSIDHLAPTPVGGTVRIVATAIEVDATTLICSLQAMHERGADEQTLIARGKQVQRILPKETLAALIARASSSASSSS
ncbi:MAG: thioesterase family protein [Phycisphaerales bacterium]